MLALRCLFLLVYQSSQNQFVGFPFRSVYTLCPRKARHGPENMVYFYEVVHCVPKK